MSYRRIFLAVVLTGCAANEAAAYYAAPLGRWVTRDPIGYEGSEWNLYEYVGSNPPVWLDPKGLLPAGRPGGWGSGHGSSGNCWRYACNDPGRPGEPHDPFPGGVPDPGGTLDCGRMRKWAKYTPEVGDPNKDGECPCGTYKVKLVLQKPDKDGWNDYHWYRQDDDGSWSSKPGHGPVAPGVTDPDKDARNRGYSIDCGYLCVRGRGADVDAPNLDALAERPIKFKPAPPIGPWFP